jgi:hypothetical protein
MSKTDQPASDHYWSFSRHPKELPFADKSLFNMYFGLGNEVQNDTHPLALEVIVVAAVEITCMLTTSASAEKTFSLAAIIRADNRIAINDAPVSARVMGHADWDLAPDYFEVILRLNPNEWY